MNGMRLFQTCPVDNAELLAVMLGNHGIEAVEKMIEPMPEANEQPPRGSVCAGRRIRSRLSAILWG